MRFVRGLLIFSYGLFTISSQTLLFREFITSFEGNDISVGVFFGSWFLWVGVGALFACRIKTFGERLIRNADLLFLIYLPVFVLEVLLIIQAREIAGIEAYALLSVRQIVFLSILVNAPVSFVTGMLFPIACRWVRQQEKLPISHVYIVEAAGSFVGGLSTTILLAAGTSSAKVFLTLAMVLSGSVFLVRLGETVSRRADTQQRAAFGNRAADKLATALSLLVFLCVVLCVAFGLDGNITDRIRIAKWTKLFPRQALQGSFQTTQAEYLYGVYQGQWTVVRQGSVCETLPDHITSGRAAAISLCQNPDAARVLVVGSGLGLCRELLRLPQIQDVTWAHCDAEYIRLVDRFIPEQLRVSDNRFHRLVGDVRSPAAEKRRYFDLVIINLPEATSSVLNRYYTLEFYQQISRSLRPGGVLSVRVPGGENIMGTELINIGASTKLTLEKVFPRLVITAGEDTWFIASESGELTGDPAALRDRFASIEAASEILPPEALLSVYLPDRVKAALESYSNADLPEGLLVNRDSRPLTHLYSLLLAAKQSGAAITRFVKRLALAGPLTFAIPIFIYLGVRIIYIFRSQRHNRMSGFDSSFLVFSAGWTGIGAVIVLMYMYQTRFGSLYLHIGVVSSLFMVGLTAGAALARYLSGRGLSRQSGSIIHEVTILIVLVLHAVILVAIALRPMEQWTAGPAAGGIVEPAHLAFGVAFILCGLCTGTYFPLAAGQMKAAGYEVVQAAGKLDSADHIGASVGGLVTSLLLVPVLGARAALLIFVLLILVNVPFAALRMYRPERFACLSTPVGIDVRLRRLRYVLFAVAASVVLCSNLLAGTQLRPSLPSYAARTLAGHLRLERASAVTGETGREITYFRVYGVEQEPNGYIFSSEDFAPEVRGFGGKINIAAYVDTEGKLIDFETVRSDETPAYLSMLEQWLESLKGRELFGPEPFADVDTVTGATVSSEAVINALKGSGRRFAAQILKRSVQSGSEAVVIQPGRLADIRGAYLIAAFVLTFVVIYYGGFRSRLAVLVANLVLGGVILNVQYSSEQIATILSLHSPSLKLTGTFLLVVVVPLLVVVFGNIYCGYICPFGAAQELLGYVIADRFRQPPTREKMQKARFVKYVVLFVLICLFFLARDRRICGSDPLVSVFSLRFSNIGSDTWVGNPRYWLLFIAVTALVGSVFYRRFWCRYLCPVGAFLSVLNGFAVLKRFLPARKFGKCEFGLTGRDNLDCIQCDRCRFERKAVASSQTPPRAGRETTTSPARLLIPAVLAVGLLVSAASLRTFFKVTGAGSPIPAARVSSAGQPRDADMQRINSMIRQKKLSDRQAQFYRKVD